MRSRTRARKGKERVTSTSFQLCEKRRQSQRLFLIQDLGVIPLLRLDATRIRYPLAGHMTISPSFVASGRFDRAPISKINFGARRGRRTIDVRDHIVES